MRRILLDTAAYSAFLRGHEDIRQILQEADQITLTPVVLGELYAGFARGRHRRKNERDCASSCPRRGYTSSASTTKRPSATRSS